MMLVRAVRVSWLGVTAAGLIASSAAAQVTTPSGTRNPLPRVEQGAGPAEAGTALAAYLTRQEFLALPDTIERNPYVCGDGVIAADPQSFVGFVNPRVIGVVVDRTDSTGQWATGVTAVTRLFSARRTRPDGNRWDALLARFQVQEDTLAFLLHRPNSRQGSGARWIVCGPPRGHPEPVSFDRRHAAGARRWEPAHTTFEQIRLFADSMEAARTGRVWRRNPPPPNPLVVRDYSAGYSRIFGRWTACKQYEVRAADHAGAPIAFTLQRREPFTALAGNLRVSEPGMVVFRDTLRVDDGRGGRVLTPADTVYPLYDETEGYGTWYLHGRKEESMLFFHETEEVSGDSRVAVVRKPRTEWWVRVRNRQGREGWLHLGDAYTAAFGYANPGHPRMC
jgi:hypothetical protein